MSAVMNSYPYTQVHTEPSIAASPSGGNHAGTGSGVSPAVGPAHRADTPVAALPAAGGTTMCNVAGKVGAQKQDGNVLFSL